MHSIEPFPCPRRHPLASLACAALTAATLTLNAADTVAAWDLTGETGKQVSSLGVGALTVTATDMVRGLGLNPAAGGDSFNANGWNDDPASIVAQDPDYFEFGFDLAPGHAVELDELFIGTKSSNTGPGIVGLFTSLDSYSTVLHQFEQPGSDWLYSRFDLSGLSTTEDSFRIRLVEIGNVQADAVGNTTSGGTFRVGAYLDDGVSSSARITGTISVVPEPRTGALLAVGAVMLWGRRRNGR